MRHPDLDALSDLWRWCSDEGFQDSPLYVAIAAGVAADDELLGLTIEAGTPHARVPNVLMAAVHERVLLGAAPALAEVYGGRSTADPFVLFRDVALGQREAILPQMAARFTNTNEVGRSALLAPTLAHVTEGWDDWVLVEAGASAGLNLRYDRYLLDYGPSGTLGDPASGVRLTCEDRSGTLPVPRRMPAPVHRVGLDRDPIDLADDDARRWLLACTWPDSDRVERAAAAHAVVAADPPRLVQGDMVEDLPALLDATAPRLPVVVVTTWAAGYLTPDQRVALADALALVSRGRTVTWVTADGPSVVPLDGLDGGSPADSVVGATVFVAGERVRAEVLAWCHPHGRWIDWRAPVRR